MEDREKVVGRGEAEETYCLCSIVGVYTSFSMVVRRLEEEGDVSMCLRMGDGIREEGILSAVWRRGRGKSRYMSGVCKCEERGERGNGERETHIFLGVGGCA